MWIGSRGEQWSLTGVVRVLAGVVSVLDAVHGKQSVWLCSHKSSRVTDGTGLHSIAASVEREKPSSE